MSKQMLVSIPAQGFWLRAAQEEGARQHRLGGETQVPGAVCPNCHKPLLTLIDLDAQDPSLELEGTGLSRLPVLFCWTCPAAQSTVLYQLSDSGDVSLINYQRGEPVNDFPYENYPRSFPRHAVQLAPLEAQEQTLVHELNTADHPGALAWKHRELAKPQHQIGGEPYLIQPLEEIFCPECRGVMPLFGTLGDDSLSSDKFTGNDFVQTLVHLCRSCRVVAVYQRCD